jgi:hypothetical protein
MYGQNIHQDGVEVLGSEDLFINYAPLWRRVLELSHTALCGAIKEDHQEPLTEDVIVGRYIYVNPPHWGRAKLFYEQSGEEGKQSILFLHTAGSDGRQYMTTSPFSIDKTEQVDSIDLHCSTVYVSKSHRRRGP